MRCRAMRDPARQGFVVREQFERETVGAIDVFGVARERHPAERPAAFAEERTDVLRHEAGNVEGVLHAGLLGVGANVVAVVERHRAGPLQRQHRFDVRPHGGDRPLHVFVRIRAAKGARFVERHAVGHVAVQRIVSAGLVGEDVWDDTAPDHLRQHVGAVAHQADRERFPVGARLSQNAERFVEIARDSIAVAGLQAALDAVRVDVDTEEAGAVHGGCQRLCAAHSAHAARDHQLAGERPGEVTARQGRRMSRRCPARFPGCRCRSTIRRSSGRTW